VTTAGNTYDSRHPFPPPLTVLSHRIVDTRSHDIVDTVSHSIGDTRAG
jgi:hypothetical protein